MQSEFQLTSLKMSSALCEIKTVILSLLLNGLKALNKSTEPVYLLNFMASESVRRILRPPVTGSGSIIAFLSGNRPPPITMAVQYDGDCTIVP